MSSKLQDYIFFKNGKKRPKDNGEYPVYGGNGILDYTNTFNAERCIVIGRVGAYCGCVYKTDKKCWISDNAICGINNEFSDLTYLYYLLSSLNLNKRSIGSGQPLMTQDILNNIEVNIHTLPIQQKIAKVLSAIDDKIELNNKINENLEQQMNNLFSDFVSKNSEIEYHVKDITLTANTGADAIQKAPIVDYNTGIKCVRVGDMTNNRCLFDWGYTKITDSIFKQYQLKKDDIIITRTASLGLNKLITEDIQAVYNNGLIRITIDKQKVLPLFLYRQLQTKDFFKFINRIEAETSVRPNMKINYLLSYSFICPNIEKQKSLIAILEPMLKQEEQLQSENQYLTQLRDTLLPKLMNGEIDVEKVEV